MSMLFNRLRVLISLTTYFMILCFTLLGCHRTIPANKVEKTREIPVDTDTTITLIFAGDMMGHTSQFTVAWNASEHCYQYDPCFRFVSEIVSAADIACVNLEMTINDGPCSSFPFFSSPPAVLDALKNAGFDLLFTANNHIADKGKTGIESTLSKIQQRGLLFTGSALDSAQRDTISPLLIEAKGLKIAFLNYTYGTNGMPVHSPHTVNVSNRQKILGDLHKADSMGAQVKIMYVHWGVEYQRNSHAGQREFAQFLADNGVDLIIGGHPHVVQEVDSLCVPNREPVCCFYSLGNFLSNQRQQYCNESLLAKVVLHKKIGKVLSISYIPLFSYRGNIDGVYQHYVIPIYDYMRNPDRFGFNQWEHSKICFAHKDLKTNISAEPDSSFSSTSPLCYDWKY